MPVPVHYKPPAPTPSTAATQPPSPPLSSSQLLATSTHSLGSSWSQILPSTSSLDPLHLPRSSYARAARAFLQRRYADALLDSQAALDGVSEVLSPQSKSSSPGDDDDRAAQPSQIQVLKLLERLLILRLTVFSSVYTHPSSSVPSGASQPFVSLLPPPSQDARSAPLISRLELAPLDFVLQSWWEVLTSYSPSLASQPPSFHPSSTDDHEAQKAVLQLPPSLVASCILSALRIEDHWSEAFDKSSSAARASDSTSGGPRAAPSRQISEFILAAHREASPPSPQLDAHPHSGEGQDALEAASQLAREMDRRKAQFSKTLELYAIHVLGVRGGEWEFAREVVGLTDGLGMGEREALLHRLDVAFEEVQTRDERSKAANEAARKAYEEERTRRANAATAAAAAAATAAANVASASSSAADGSPLSDSERRNGNGNGNSNSNGLTSSLYRSRPRTDRRGSASSATSWTSVGGGATTGDESETSLTRQTSSPSSARRSTASSHGSGASKSKSRDHKVNTSVSGGGGGGEDFASKRQAVRDFLDRGNQRGTSALVSEDEASTTSTGTTRRSDVDSRSGAGTGTGPGVVSRNPSTSTPASRNEALASTGLNALLDRLRSFFTLFGVGGNTSISSRTGPTSAISKLLGNAAVVVALLMILRRATLAARSSASSIPNGTTTNTRRRNLPSRRSQAQEGSVVGRAAAKVWQTISMGTKVSYL